MKLFSVLLLAMALGLSGCKDDRVPPLEKRVSALEVQVKTLEDAQKAKVTADSTSETRFKQCVTSADDDFTGAIRLNGTKNRDGSYAVPTSSLEQMQRQKRDRLEECKLLYK